MRRDRAFKSGLIIVTVMAALLVASCTPAPVPRSSDLPAQPTPSASTQSVEGFYRGKTLTIMVGSTPGGGYDTYARLLARHVSKYIPGQPNVIVENRPGAGTLLAANTGYRSAPKDGTVIVKFGGHLALDQIFGTPAVEFDLQQFNYLDEPTTQTAVCAAVEGSGINRLEDVRGEKQLILGGTAPGALIDNPANVLKNVLGFNIKVVSGYPGTSQIRLAAEQGELMGGCWQWESLKTTWADGLTSGQVRVIVQGGRQAHPDLPTVPVMRDLARTEEQRQLVDAAITNMTEMYMLYALPPGVPAERIAALRSAFASGWRDPALIAEAQHAQLSVEVVPASVIEERVRDLLSLPPAVVEQLRRVLLS
jgi:tripartite-type tricarboxylate transporter receptor subunit TctC